MKKGKTCLFTALLSLSFLGLVSCGGETTSDSSIINSDITLSQTSADMIFGDTLELVASSSTKEAISWSSSDTSVATVNDGTVLATGKGQATITASIGQKKATCLVNVGFGKILPSLSLDNVSSSTIALGKGTSFPLRGLASFNGKNYPCQISISIENKEIVSLSGNSLVGKQVGNTKVTVKGIWNNFSNQLMSKTFDVNVSSDILIYPEVTLTNKKGVMSSIDLSLLPSWQGETYDSTAKVEFFVKENGILKTASVSVVDDKIISITSTGFVQAKKEGETKIIGTYTDENGNSYYSYVDVKVTCPVATYNGQLKVSSESLFPLDQYFGEGALLTYAKQGDKELDFLSNGYIDGLSAKGDDSEPLLILTNKGGFYFENSFVYTRALNKDNFLSSLKLEAGKVIDGYYILDSDITTEIDMTSQMSSYYESGKENIRYFKGTFDGQGHIVKTKVGREGIFGGLGENAVIKNTHFEFTFSSTDYNCGLARNNWTNNVGGWGIALSNLYVTTTNYYDHSYSLFENRFNNMTMNDVYVNLTLSKGVGEVTSAKQEKGALFRVDTTISAGPYGSFTGDFRNVYVVSEKFMPASSGYMGTQNLFATYAKNDVDKLGDYERAGVTDQVTSCVLGAKPNSDKIDLFGSLPTVKWYFSATQNTNLVFIYLTKSSISNGGVVRYDTTAELKSSGVNKVGSWDVL